MDVLIRKMAHTLLYFLHLIVTLPHNLYNKILDHSLTGSSNDSPHFISGSDFIKAFITFNTIKRFNFVLQASEFQISFTNIELSHLRFDPKIPVRILSPTITRFSAGIPKLFSALRNARRVGFRLLGT